MHIKMLYLYQLYETLYIDFFPKTTIAQGSLYTHYSYISFFGNYIIYPYELILIAWYNKWRASLYIPRLFTPKLFPHTWRRVQQIRINYIGLKFFEWHWVGSQINTAAHTVYQPMNQLTLLKSTHRAHLVVLHQFALSVCSATVPWFLALLLFFSSLCPSRSDRIKRPSRSWLQGVASAVLVAPSQTTSENLRRKNERANKAVGSWE